MSVNKVFSVPELADMILSLHRNESSSGPDNFAALQAVNKSWKSVVWSIIWRNPPAGGLRPILAHLGDYDVIKVRLLISILKQMSDSMRQGEVKLRVRKVT